MNGKEIFEFLDDPSKEKVLSGQKPGSLTDAQWLAVSQWVIASGTTYDSYFPDAPRDVSDVQRTLEEALGRQVDLTDEEIAELARQAVTEGTTLTAQVGPEASLPNVADTPIPNTTTSSSGSGGGSAHPLTGATGPSSPAHPLTGATGTAPEKSVGDMTMEEMMAALAASNRSSGGGGGGGGGAPRLTVAQQQEADRAEVEQMLAEQFGGFSFFLNKHNSALNVGLTADGTIVSWDDPNATTVKPILDLIVERGITAQTRIIGVLQKTEWWQTTDVRNRQFDVQWGEMSEPQQQEFLEPILDGLREDAQFLGFELDSGRAWSLAKLIAREGEETDQEYIRGLLVNEAQFNSVGSDLSGFAASRDAVQQMSRDYFVPIGESEAAEFAEQLYVGTMDEATMRQYFKEHAISRFGSLAGTAVDTGGITVAQYFAPYKHEIERMLDRPNVDILEEFAEVIEHIPGDGDGQTRPMTLHEMRTFIRGTDEWQGGRSAQGQARSMAFAIGQAFGEDF